MFEKVKNPHLREFLYFLRTFLIAALIAFLFVRFIGTRSVVSGPSMIPTLEDGDNLFVWRVAYAFSEPERFDIIVLNPYEGDSKTHYVKRVIGLPGEKIAVKDGKIYINGKPLEGDVYGREPVENDFPETEIPEGEYFVIGDNRNNSKDSRSEAVGTIPKSNILGKAIFRFWPFSGFGTLK